VNKLQTFCAVLDGGFLRAADVSPLVALDRLFPVLVRCGACRFTCAAQDLEHLKRCIAAGGDYVRDVSLPIGWEVRAAGWVHEHCSVTPCAMLPASFVAERKTILAKHARPISRAGLGDFNEADCGGVFDGRGVVSDADSGL
jgi:hypothetical protein